MIIMLDGVNGSGKTTYAYHLKLLLGVKVCRVFRSDDKNLHWGSSGEKFRKELEKIKVPINTHIDDIFMADFMRSFQVDAILDRTIISAIVYGRTYLHLEGWYKGEGNSKRLLEFWTYLIGCCKLPIVYVWLDVDYDVAKGRTEGRWRPNKSEYQKLRREYERAFQRIRFRKYYIDTGITNVKDGVDRIIRWVK